MPRKKEEKKKRQDDEFDDGRTIADMNVDGMPWYTGKRKAEEPGSGGDGSERINLTKKEGRAFLRGVVLAALLAGGVYFIVFAAFILFCIYVWFR
ncbi:MAG: hypothetical protein ACOYIA_05420 [Eubacteriales bacterium]|jgi:hypothetical protein